MGDPAAPLTGPRLHLSQIPRGTARFEGKPSTGATSDLLSRSNKALRDGVQLSEAITGEGAAIFRHACWMDLEGIVSKRTGSRYVSDRTRAWLKTKNPNVERT